MQQPWIHMGDRFMLVRLSLWNSFLWPTYNNMQHNNIRHQSNPTDYPRKPISLHTNTHSSVWLPLKNRSSCLTNKPTWINKCTHPPCVKALTLAIANLHDWLEVSKQWGNSALPIIACYWYHCLVCLLWVQRNAFHLLSGNTMLLVVVVFFAAGKLKWWDVPMCHCMFFHQVSICSWQMTTQTSITREATLWVPQFLSLHI